MSQHDSGFLVVVWCRDRGVSVGGAEACHDINLRSRPELLKLGVAIWSFEVAIWSFEVAT